MNKKIIIGLFLISSFTSYIVLSNWEGQYTVPSLKDRSPTTTNIFKMNTIANNNYITYIAATSSHPIPWKIHLKQSAYLSVFIPPGVSRVNMGINGIALAASQGVMVKNYGEMGCEKIPTPPKNSEVTYNDYAWHRLSDSRTMTHFRKEENKSKAQCLFFVFYNLDNLHRYVQLAHVGFSYLIENRILFEQWINNKASIAPIEKNIEWQVKVNNVILNSPVTLDEKTSAHLHVKLQLNKQDFGLSVGIVSAISWEDHLGKIHWQQKIPSLLSNWVEWDGHLKHLKAWKQITTNSIKISLGYGNVFPTDERWNKIQVQYYVGYRIDETNEKKIIMNTTSPFTFKLKPKKVDKRKIILSLKTTDH
jgi:hypothetical protein